MLPVDRGPKFTSALYEQIPGWAEESRLARLMAKTGLGQSEKSRDRTGTSEPEGTSDENPKSGRRLRLLEIKRA